MNIQTTPVTANNMPPYTVDEKNKIFYLHHAGELTFGTVAICRNILYKLKVEPDNWRLILVNRQEKIANLLNEE